MMQVIERVSLNEFMPFVMASCATCPEPIAIAAIRQACMTFCQRSGWLRRTVQIDQQSKVASYPIWSDKDEQIVLRKSGLCKWIVLFRATSIGV